MHILICLFPVGIDTLTHSISINNGKNNKIKRKKQANQKHNPFNDPFNHLSISSFIVSLFSYFGASITGGRPPHVIFIPTITIYHYELPKFPIKTY